MVSRPASGVGVAGVIAAALRTAQHLEVTPERAIPAGIGGPVDANDRAAQRTCQVERASVAGDYQRDTPGDGDELLQRAFERRGRAVGGADDACPPGALLRGRR